MDPLALARALALDQGDEDALREEDARAEVRDGNADAHRPLSRDAGDRHQAPHALRDLVDSRTIAIGAALSEAGDAAVDQARVDRADAFVVDAEPLLHVGAVVLHDDVGVLRELLEDLHGLGIAQVQRHAPLVAVQILEVEPVPIAAHAVSRPPARPPDLDGVGAPVDQLAHARRAGARPREIEDVELRERRRIRGDLAAASPRATLFPGTTGAYKTSF